MVLRNYDKSFWVEIIFYCYMGLNRLTDEVNFSLVFEFLG